MQTSTQFKKGINWTLLQQGVNIGINYISLIVLAWFLSPSDFGLIALSTVLIGFFETINGFGIPQIIIKDQITDKKVIATYFSSSTLLSSVLIVLCVSIGWLYSFFFNNSNKNDLFLIICVSSLGIIFSNFSSLFQSFYQRDMNFKTPALFHMASIFLSNVITIPLAISGWGYWALVIRNISPLVFLSCFYFIFSKYEVSFNSKLKLNQSDRKFSFFISSNQVVNYFARNMDYVIIGRFFDINILGQYSIAYRLMLFPMKMLSSRVQAVLFPLLSNMKGNTNSMIIFYIKVVSFIAFISFPLMGVVGVTAQYWVPLVFSDLYNLLGQLIQILCIIGAFQAITSPISSLYLVSNQAKLMFLFSTVSSTIFILGFLIGGLTNNIIIFASIYASINLILSFLVSNYLPLSRLGFNFKEFILQVLKPFYPSALAYIFSWLILNWIYFEGLTDLLIMTIIGVSLYLILFFATYMIQDLPDLKNKYSKIKNLIS